MVGGRGEKLGEGEVEGGCSCAGEASADDEEGGGGEGMRGGLAHVERMGGEGEWKWSREGDWRKKEI